MSDGMGNEAQVRVVAEQIADAAVTRFAQRNPDAFREQSARVEIPAPLKWGGGIFAAVLTLATGAGLLWLVSTVNTMQVTLARMDERMTSGAIRDGRVDDLERRVQVNEDEIARLANSEGQR